MTDSHLVIEELQKKNRDLIGKLAILQKQFDDALVVTHTFDGISAKNAELEKEIHNYISKNDDLVRRIQILSQTNSELTKKFEDERANGQSHLRCEISDLQDQLRRCQVDHEKVVASLNMKIEQTQKEHSFVVENYQKEIRRIYDAASQFLGTPIRETDTLITLLLSKTNPNANSGQGANGQNSLPCPQCIHAKVDVRSKDQSSLKIIRSEIKSLKNKTNKLNSIACDQAQSIENLVNEKTELLEANKCLHSQLDDIQRDFDEQIKEIALRHKKLKLKLAASIENEKALEKEKIIISEQINSLKKTISEKEDENHRLLNETQQLKDQNAISDKDISTLKEKCQELNDALQKNNEAAEEIRLEAKNSKNALQSIHRIMNDQKEELMNLQSQRKKLISHLQMLNSTLCQYEKFFNDPQSKYKDNRSKIELGYSRFPSDLNDLLSQISTNDESKDEDIVQNAFSTIFNYYDNVVKSQNESINRYKNDLEAEKMRLNQIVDNFNRRIQNSLNEMPNTNNQATTSGFNQNPISSDMNNGMNQNSMQFPGNYNDNNNSYEYNNGMQQNHLQSSNYSRNENSDFVANNHGNQSFSNQSNQPNLPYGQPQAVNPNNCSNQQQFQTNPNNNKYSNSGLNNTFPSNSNGNEFNSNNNNSNMQYPNANPNNYNDQQQMPNNNNNNGNLSNPNAHLNNPYDNSGFFNGNNKANPYPNNSNTSGFNPNSQAQHQFPNGSNSNTNQSMHSNPNGNNAQGCNTNNNNSNVPYPHNSNNSNMNPNNYNEQQLPNNNNCIPNQNIPPNHQYSSNYNSIPSQNVPPNNQYPNNNNSGLNANSNSSNPPYPNNNNASGFNTNNHHQQQFPNGNSINSNSHPHNNNFPYPNNNNNNCNLPYSEQQSNSLPYTNRNLSCSDHPNNIIYNRLDTVDKSSQSHEKLLEKISQKENELHEIFAILHVNCFLDAKSSLEQLQLTIQILQKKLRDKKDKMKELITEYQQYQSDSEEKIQLTQKAIIKAQKKLQESEEMRENERSEYELRIKANEDQMKQMKIRIDQKVEKNTESRNRLEEEIRNKNNENYQLLQQIEELKNDISKKEVVIQQLRSFTKYFAKKQSQKHNTEQEVMKSQLSQMINQLKTKNVELKKSLGEVKEKMNSSELQYSKAKKQISDYCSKIQELEVQLESFQNEAERGRSLAESKHKAALIAQETEFQSHIEDSKYKIENAKREIMAYVGLQFCSFFNAKEQIDSNNFETFIQRLRQKFESLVNLENNLRRLLSLNSVDSIESAVSHLMSQKKL